jgi:small subunit ribosomal protein S16
MVVIDSHSASDGRALEVVGHYDPKTEPETLRVERDRIQYWVEKGAQLSDTVRSLLDRQPVADLPETEQAEVVETAGS